MARQLGLTLEIAVAKQQATEALRDVEASLKRVTDEAAKSGKVTDDQSAKFATLSKGAATLRDQIKGYGDQLKGSTDATIKQTTAAGLLTGAIARYVSAAGIIAAIKHTADWADRLLELHDSTGLSVKMLQQLDAVTKRNGSSIETLTRAFGTMQDRVAGGDKSATRAFEKLGLSFDAFQKMRPDDQIENLAIAVMKIEDPMQRATVVTDLFGRTGVQLIPTLAEIAQGMDGLTVASEKNMRALAQLSDWWETLKSQLAVIIVEHLGPMIERAHDMHDATLALNDRWRAWASTINGLLIPGFQKLTESVLEYSEALFNVKQATVPLPKDPGAPSLFGGGGSGTPDIDTGPSAFDQQIKRITDSVNAQIGLQKTHTAVIKEQRTEQDAIAKILDHQYQVTAGMVGLFGIKAQTLDQVTQVKDPSLPVGAVSTNQNVQDGLPTNGVLGPGFNASKPPSYWRARFGQLGSMQSQWAAQNFGSAEGWVNSAQGWMYGAQDVMDNGDPVVNATNVKGRGRRALRGAIAGAETGGKYGGPYGAMGGAVIGALIGAFRNPAFEDVFNRIAKNFGVEVSDELAKGIAQRAKDEFHGNRQAAEIASLGSIIQEGGGLNKNNIGQMTDRLHDAFSMYGTGAFDKKQLKETLDSSFGYFADYYTKLGGLADESFTRIIQMSKDAGVESAAVTEYVNQQVDAAVSGLETYLTNATVKTQQAADGVAAASILLFDQIRKGPGGLREAIDVVGPLMETFKEQLVETGLNGTEAFDKIYASVEAFHIEGVAKATTAVDGLNQALTGLANSTLLNADAFTGLSRAMVDEIDGARQALIAQGKDGSQALQLNAEGLQTIYELQQRFHWAVDDATQAMLDQAKAQGLIGDQFKDVNERQLDAMNRMADTLDRIAEKFGAVGDAAVDAGKVIDDEMGRERTVPVTFEYPDGERQPWDESGRYGPGGGDNPNGYAAGGVVLPFHRRTRNAANGLYVPQSTDTVPAMLTPGEGVLSRRGMRALSRLNEGGSAAGGMVFQAGAIVVHANDAEGGKAAADALLARLRSRGYRMRAAV